MSTTPKFVRMGHVAIDVADVHTSLKFYRDVLGLSVAWDKSEDWGFLRLGNDDLALLQKDVKKHHPHVGMRLANREEVTAMYNYLKSKGVKMMTEPMPHRDDSFSFYFEDPDGNVIEAMYDPRYER